MPEAATKRSWTRVAFGDVVRLSKERSRDPEADGFERYLGLEHLDSGDLKIRTWGNVADGTTFTNVFRPGQVLFGKRRAYQRKLAVAEFSGVCSGDVYVFESKSAQLLPELLPFICQTDSFFEHAVKTSAGSLSPRTNWKSVAAYEFSLPPLEEQRRLVAVLTAVNNLHSQHQSLQMLGDELSVALLAHALFGHRVPGIRNSRPPLSDGWRWINLGEVVLDTKAGLFKRKDLYGYGHNIAGVSDLYHHRSIDGQTFDLVPATPAEVAEYQLHEGDLLYGESSLVRDGIARTLPVTSKGSGALFAWHTRRIRIDRNRLSPFFASAYLNSPFGRRDIMSRATTTVLTGMTVADFLSIPIPIASVSMQERIVERLERIWESQQSSEMRRRHLQAVADAFAETALSNGNLAP